MANNKLSRKHDMQIEQLADEIVNGGLPKIKLIQKKSDLARYLLEAINLNEFAKMDLTADNKVLSNTAEAEHYNGMVFSSAYKAALGKYGQKDEQTGETIPFLQLFRAFYNTKKPEIKQQNFKEKALKPAVYQKQEQITALLQNASAKYGRKKKLSFNPAKYEDCQKFIACLNATQKEKDALMQKLSDLYTKSFRVYEKSDADEENSLAASVLDSGLAAEQMQKEQNINILSAHIDKILPQIKNPTDKEYAVYYITLNIILKYSNYGYSDIELNDYIDCRLADFYFRHASHYKETKHIKDIIAAYTGNRPDTVRKRLDRVRKFFVNKPKDNK